MKHAENGFPATYSQLILSFYFDAHQHDGIEFVFMYVQCIHRIDNDGGKNDYRQVLLWRQSVQARTYKIYINGYIIYRARVSPMRTSGQHRISEIYLIVNETGSFILGRTSINDHHFVTR